MRAADDRMYFRERSARSHRWMDILALAGGLAIAAAAWYVGNDAWPGTLRCDQWRANARPGAAEHVDSIQRYFAAVVLATEMEDAPDIDAFVAAAEGYCTRHPHDLVRFAIESTYADSSDAETRVIMAGRSAKDSRLVVRTGGAPPIR